MPCMFIAKQKYVAIKTILSAIKNNQAQYTRFMNMGPLTRSPFSKIETNNKQEQNRTKKHLITQNCSQALTFKKTQLHELLIFRLVISEIVKLQSSFPSGSPVSEQIRLLLQWVQQRGGWSSTSSALSCSWGKPRDQRDRSLARLTPSKGLLKHISDTKVFKYLKGNICKKNLNEVV